MVDQDEENQSAEDPASVLKSLEKKALLNKYLFIAVLCFTGLVLSVMGTAMTVMYFKIATLTEAEAVRADDPFEEQFLALEEQLMLLADFRKSELKKIAAYTHQLDKIASECNVDKAAPYRNFLVAREKDFQKFLSTLQEGTSSLANMNQGERDWLEPYTQSLEQLKQSSGERQHALEMLLTGS